MVQSLGDNPATVLLDEGAERHSPPRGGNPDCRGASVDSSTSGMPAAGAFSRRTDPGKCG